MYVINAQGSFLIDAVSEQIPLKIEVGFDIKAQELPALRLTLNILFLQLHLFYSLYLCY